jgi:hypothetical protein
MVAALGPLTGCGGGDATETRANVDIPATPPGVQTRWVLDQLGGATGPSAGEAEQRFAEVFLAQVAAVDMVGTFDQLRAYGPFEVTGYQGAEASAQAALRNGAGEPMSLEVAVDDDYLDRVVRGVHRLVHLGEFNLFRGLIGAGVRAERFGGVRYQVADFGDAIERRVDGYDALPWLHPTAETFLDLDAA